MSGPYARHWGYITEQPRCYLYLDQALTHGEALIVTQLINAIVKSNTEKENTTTMTLSIRGPVQMRVWHGSGESAIFFKWFKQRPEG